MLDKTKRYLYLVADARVRNPDLGLERIVELAIEGGVNIVQYRDKLNDSRQFYDQALRLKKICEYYGVPFIINDRVDIALATQADGVHIGQGDLPLEKVRPIAGNMLVGYSVKTREQARWGEEYDADYLGAGTVFTTSSKSDAGQAIGLDGLRQVVEAVDIPVIAIGGINESNVAECMRTGVSGIAVISAITLASDPREAAEALARVVFAEGGS